MRGPRLGRPALGPLGAAFGLGAVVACGQAPLGFWWLALPGLWALFALIAGAQTRRAAGWLGWFGGAGYFALALNWIIEPFLIDPEVYGWMAPFALVFMAFGLALFWAFAAFAAHALGRGAGARALALAVVLTAAEMARGYVLTGFPWALIGHIWIGWAPMQVAALFGPNALTLMTTLAVALPLARPRGAGLAAGAMLLGVAAGFGLWRGGTEMPPARDIIVRLIQPNAEQHLKWQPEQALFYLDRQLAMTSATPAPGNRVPDLVVWPETAVPYLLNQAGGLLAEISAAAAGSPVAVGIQRTEGWRGWNSMAVLGPGGTVQAVYDKHHLVPFGEYLPMGDLLADWFGITAFAAQEGNGYSPGPGAVVLDLGHLGQVLPLICYEAIFPGDLRAAPTRPDWVLQITNDAWFGDLSGPWQHLAQTRLRAVEQGLPVLRAANTGISAVIDARGRVVSSLGLNEAGFIDAAVPAALAATPYARWGEGPLLALLLAGIALLGLARARKAH